MTPEDHIAASYPAHLRVVLSAAEKALAGSGFDALLIHAGTTSRFFSDDQEMPFRTNPYFAHFLPLPGPEHILFLEPGARPLLISVTPEDYWYESAPIGDPFWKKEFDIREVASAEAAWQEVPKKRFAYVGNDAARAASPDAANPSRILSHLDWQRSFKTEYEIFCIEEANHRAGHAHEAARDAFLAGASELEIHEAYLEQLAQTEHALPYGTIVALNEKGSVLHYQNKRLLEDGMTLLLDAGASFHGYASDVTRTHAMESCDVLFRGLLGGVEKLQQELCRMALPGVPFAELHASAHQKIGSLLNEIGVLKIPGEEAAEKGLTRAFFPHGVGHFLGLTVHDVGGNQKDAEGGVLPPSAKYPKLRMTRTIEEGMVFTVEPGVYFIPMLLSPHRSGESAKYFNWELIDRLTPFGGIRIEDDVLATRTGNRNLTRQFLP